MDITIDAASIDTREPQRDAHLRSADFLEVETFPTLTFKSRSVEHVDGDDYKLIGDLTIHGVTRQVALDVTSFGTLLDPWGNEKAGFSAVDEDQAERLRAGLERGARGRRRRRGRRGQDLD